MAQAQPALLRLSTGDHGGHQDTVFDYADIAMFAADYFIKAYPERIKARYQLSELPETGSSCWISLPVSAASCARGLRICTRPRKSLVNEFRSGMLGRISLETPEMVSVEIVEAQAEAEQKARRRRSGKRSARPGLVASTPEAPALTGVVHDRLCLITRRGGLGRLFWSWRSGVREAQGRYSTARFSFRMTKVSANQRG